eukprot:CAMPEP_0119372008 /NCGR_PEP_ID=MMETSP1334-20130426/18066_1 /TAXON_ID=127549 /ORGANISM="Calcidiscus leptoporus, Strain RCC1130" /LENGTH=152 /DNA_ID=CAMNT_0007389391 /DNA_START=346 /DNA_END=804 /DNA_ORIENTATION=+
MALNFSLVHFALAVNRLADRHRAGYEHAQPGRHLLVLGLKLLDPLSVLVQLRLHVDDAVENEEDEQGTARDVEIALVPEEAHGDFAGELNLNRREEGVVERRTKSFNNPNQVEDVERKHAEHSIPHARLLPKPFDPFGKRTTHVIARHRHDE